jgi:disulfide bond formation protein DsbB
VPDAVFSPDQSPSTRAFRMALAICVIAFVTIAGAWFFQLVLGIQPCPMCLEQRYAYYIAIPLAAVLAMAAVNEAPRSLLVAGFAVLFCLTVFNGAFGAYHAGVEWGFWPGPTECTGSAVDFGNPGNLMENLKTAKIVRCDEVQWSFLGLSLAGYNALISALMAALAGWGLLGLGRRRQV